jgi:hypothetical protein
VRGQGSDELEVVILKTLGAPRRRARRRSKRVPAETEPDPIAIGRVTVVAADGFADEAEAQQWLDNARKDERRREGEVEAALQSVNRAIHAQRVCTADPYVYEVGRAHAREVRLGYGSGDEVVEGHWRGAVVIPPPRRRLRRRQMLEPQQEVAGILSGRARVYASEDLALRARLDLDQARPVQAALQLRAAVDALEAELEAGGEQGGSWQREHGAAARELAAAALQGQLAEGQASALTEILEELEGALRRRRSAQDR